MRTSPGLARTLALACGALALLAATVQADEATATDPAALAAAGRYAEARDAARDALVKDGANAKLARLLQDVLRAVGDADGAAKVSPSGAPEVVRQGLAARLLEGKAAVKALTPVTKTDGAPACFRLDLAAAHLEAGSTSSAESVASAYVKEIADDPDGHAMLGTALAARGKHAGARGAFEQALSLAPGHARAAVGLARLHASKDRDQDARKTLQAALGVHPRHPALLLALAEDQARVGEYDPALRTLGEVLKLEVPKPDVHATMAEVQRAKRDYPAAERCAKQALELSQNHTRAMRVLGFVKFKRGDYEGALGEYQGVALLLPEDASIHADIALVHIMTDDLKAAEAAAKQALKIDKNLLEGHLRMGQALYLRGKAKQAKKSFGAVLKQDKQHVLVNRYMGYTLLDEGKAKTAIKHFKVVADALPSDSSSMRMIGRCQLAMGKVDQAIESFQEAVSRDEKDAFALFDLGKGFEKQEKWDDAAAAYERAIAADAKLPYPHLYLAELLDDVQGEPDKALPHYKAYLELGGHDEGDAIKKRIEQLENP